eukprot:m.18870 g.18870  ORF g.18870 m.18870 type:complete len:62 (-) comp8569_c0_seq1:641-826(-)
MVRPSTLATLTTSSASGVLSKQALHIQLLAAALVCSFDLRGSVCVCMCLIFVSFFNKHPIL